MGTDRLTPYRFDFFLEHCLLTASILFACEWSSAGEAIAYSDLTLNLYINFRIQAICRRVLEALGKAQKHSTKSLLSLVNMTRQLK